MLALSVTAGILLAPSIPSWDGMGTAWTSFLPWTAVLLVLLAAIAAVRRAWWGLSAVIVSLMVWSVVFVPQLMPANAAGAAELTVATQNIGAANTDPVASANTLATSGAGIVAVQEIVASSAGATAVLDATYAHHARVSTVGLWSVWAMDEPQELQLGMSWARAFRVVVHHDAGDIAVYAVHLPSVRPGRHRGSGCRRQRARRPGRRRPGGPGAGDGRSEHRRHRPDAVCADGRAADSRETVKGGFGFTWPASFPLTRPDHVLGRGLTPVADQVLMSGGSDHRAVVVGLDLAG